MKTKILILLVTTILLLGCSEDDNPFTLPNATQTGANTAGCYIDGDLYVLKNANTSNAWLGPSKTIDLKYQYDESAKLWYIYIYIVFQNEEKGKEAVDFILKSKQKMTAGKIQLMEYVEGQVSNSALLYQKGKTEDNAGEIILTKIDTNDGYNLISGSFNFIVNNRKTGEVVKISDGRFDLKVPKNK